MELPEVYSKLTHVFHEVFDDDALILSPTLTAHDVEGWDSLKNVRLLLSVEKAFGVRFSAAEAGTMKNVGDLAASIHSKL